MARWLRVTSGVQSAGRGWDKLGNKSLSYCMRESESDSWELRGSFKPQPVVSIQSLTWWEDLFWAGIFKTDMEIFAVLFPVEFMWLIWLNHINSLKACHISPVTLPFIKCLKDGNNIQTMYHQVLLLNTRTKITYAATCCSQHRDWNRQDWWGFICSWFSPCAVQGWNVECWAYLQ